MRTYLILILFSLLMSCKSKETKNKGALIEKVNNLISSVSSSMDVKVKIDKINCITYSEKSNKFYDSILLVRYNQKYLEYEKLAKQSLDKAKEKRNEYNIYSYLNDKKLNEINKYEFEKAIEGAKRFSDSMTFYNTQDSLIKKRMLENKENRIVYYAKFYVDYTAYKGQESHQTKDYLEFYFDKNFNILP